MTPEQIRAFQKWISAVNEALENDCDHNRTIFGNPGRHVKAAIVAGEVLAAAISKVEPEPLPVGTVPIGATKP